MPTPFFLWLYLGKLKIWRFHIRCPNCRSVIVFRTDPENKDYEIVFHVVESLHPKIILGAPFLEESGILKDFRESIVNRLRKN